MSQIHIILDASVLPRNLRSIGHAFGELRSLVQAGLVSVGIPYVALNEWHSQRRTEYAKCLKEFRKSLDDIRRHGWSDHLPPPTAASFREVTSTIESTDCDANGIAEVALQAFISDFQVEVLQLPDGAAQEVFERYFAGRPPFPAPKERTHLPDAFILQTVIDYCRSHSEASIICAVADKNLKAAIESETDAVVFETLKDALQSDQMQQVFCMLQVARDWSEHRKAILHFLEVNTDAIQEHMSGLLVDLLSFESVCSPSIPEDNNEATITGVGSPDNLEMDWDRLAENAPGWFSVPFSVRLEALLEFNVYRADAFDVPNWVHVSIGDFEDDHYFEAEGYAELLIHGWLAFRYSGDELRAESPTLPHEIEVESLQSMCLSEDK